MSSRWLRQISQLVRKPGSAIVFLFASLLVAGNAWAAAVRPGDLFATDYYFGGRLWRIDPATGAATVVASGEGLYGAYDLAFHPTSGHVFVASDAYGQFGLGAVTRINPATGEQQIISSGFPFDDPNGIAFEGGQIVVSDRDCCGGGQGAVFRVDSTTGARTTLSSRGAFFDPVRVAVTDAGDILVVDANCCGGGGGVLRIDPITGAQAVVASGGNFYNPFGIAMDELGDVIVVDAGSYASGSVPGKLIRVNPTTGSQTVITEFLPSGQSPFGIAIDPSGDIFVAENHGSSPAGNIYRVDPVTGSYSIVVRSLAFGPNAVAIAPLPEPASPATLVIAIAFIALILKRNRP